MDSLIVNIVNRRTTEDNSAVYVGRPTPLGNPFTAQQEGSREVAIAKYKQWLNLQWTTLNRRVTDELKVLAKQLKRDGSITLSCWCAPESCHAEIVGDALIALINKDLV